jgi:hypothetical protein
VLIGGGRIAGGADRELIPADRELIVTVRGGSRADRCGSRADRALILQADRAVVDRRSRAGLRDWSRLTSEFKGLYCKMVVSSKNFFPVSVFFLDQRLPRVSYF